MYKTNCGFSSANCGLRYPKLVVLYFYFYRLFPNHFLDFLAYESTCTYSICSPDWLSFGIHSRCVLRRSSICRRWALSFLECNRAEDQKLERRDRCHRSHRFPCHNFAYRHRTFADTTDRYTSRYFPSTCLRLDDIACLSWNRRCHRRSTSLDSSCLRLSTPCCLERRA